MKIQGIGLNDTNNISVDANDLGKLTKDMMDITNIVSRHNEQMDELSVRYHKEFVSENGNKYEQASSVLEYQLTDISNMVKELSIAINDDICKKRLINTQAAMRVGGLK